MNTTHPLKEIVVDAGPIIAFFAAKDPDHAQVVKGFQQLQQAKTKIITPTPIIFEVYKWLLQKTTVGVARDALDILLEEFVAIAISRQELLELQEFIRKLPRWQGSLEDATVIATAFRFRCPVWTINYRDFSSFKALEFWIPD
ncbi:PIN domain-containing protein [Pannus brasiliensis CCIBt3594]|uniref:Ribonuclease VapC n=1 Tax=Pannus brasiliensis CCIBt3594 TaxID=1427578 RepID=A0AAW9QLB2_9CHRO